MAGHPTIIITPQNESRNMGATDLNFGCQVITFGDVPGTIEAGKRVEAAGFDQLGVPDHLFHPGGEDGFMAEPAWEAYSVLGALARETSDVELWPMVTDSVRRHPTELAHVAATIDHLSNGRFGFGIGAGEIFNFSVINDIDWSDPFTRFVETVKIVDGLWESSFDDPFGFEGDYFELEETALRFKPIREPRPPIWVGGYGYHMRGFAGAFCDGWIPWVMTPDVYAEDLPRVLDVAEDRGRDPEQIDRAVMVPANVGSDHDAAREEAIEANRVNLALRPPLLDRMGYEDIAEESPLIREMAFSPEESEQLRQAANTIPEAAIEEAIIAGDPEAAIEQIDDWVDAGVDNLVIIPFGDFEETMDHFEETIIPYYQGE